MRPCTIVGNVGADPEMRYTPNGFAVTNFSLALYSGKSPEGNEQTTWVRVTAWKDLAELVSKKVGKGDKLQVEGYLQPARLFEGTDKETGTPEMKGSIELVAFAIKALEFIAVKLDDEIPIDAEKAVPYP